MSTVEIPKRVTLRWLRSLSTEDLREVERAPYEDTANYADESPGLFLSDYPDTKKGRENGVGLSLPLIRRKEMK